ncbi:MAG: nitrate reductase molybdenum cofactor assembly chaperone [Solirubrobacterales bacterium]
MASKTIHPLKVVSVLLQYPEADMAAVLNQLDPRDVGPLSRRLTETLAAHLEWRRGQSLHDLQCLYAETFDFNRRCSLHLTYHINGDSRQRGLGLLKIKTAYREAGFEFGESELPDFLPVMLEFAALADGSVGRELLERHRPAIELIRGSLQGQHSHWAGLFDLIREGLPSLSKRQIARIRRLAENGPPSEEVGLEPFAPPEVMPAGADEIALPLIGGRQ